MLTSFINSKSARWIGQSNGYFTNNNIYKILRMEYDEAKNPTDLILSDNTNEEYYLNPEEYDSVVPSNESNSSSKEMPTVQSNRPVIQLDSREISIKVDVDENVFPYWARYVVIDTNGVYAYANNPTENTGMKERITLPSPITLELPSKQEPFEIMVNLWKEGKITYEQLKAEMKLVIK